MSPPSKPPASPLARAPDRAQAQVSWLPAGAQRPRSATVLQELLIGRDPACRVLVAAAGVSRRHARLRLDPTGLHLDNLSRSLPIGVNRREELAPGGSRVLRAGETFSVGPQEFRVDRVHRVGEGPGATCANPTCLRPVPPDATDCPWCGVSLSFAATHHDPS